MQPGTRNRSWDPIQSSTAWLSWVARLSQTWWTRSGGIDAIAAARDERLAALLAFTRANSPHYREAWRTRPADAPYSLTTGHSKALSTSARVPELMHSPPDQRSEGSMSSRPVARSSASSMSIVG